MRPEFDTFLLEIRVQEETSPYITWQMCSTSELDISLCCCHSFLFCPNLFQHGAFLKMPLALQETVAASRRSFTARELRSGTDYLVTVIAQYPNSVGESVSAKQRTSEWREASGEWRESTQRNITVSSTYAGSLPGVSSLRLDRAGFFSLSLGWDRPSTPVQGYRLTYGPRG